LHWLKSSLHSDLAADENRTVEEQDISVSEGKLRSEEQVREVVKRERGSQQRSERLVLRIPRASDGPRISRLIDASPPLDVNSAYCNLLQCTDFADTCVVAERDDELLGWVSAYRPPAAPDRLFVWQVAVAPAARGEGSASKMLDALLVRPAVAGATSLVTTITENNAASWRLFEAFARRHGATLQRSPRFERETHFAGAHESEWEARIAPLPILAK
jgi:L-2,4-diaminobutyric acid acetyltransferase